MRNLRSTEIWSMLSTYMSTLNATIMAATVNYSFQHYNDVIMSAMASQITGVSTVCSTAVLVVDEKAKLRVTGLCEGNPPVTCGFPHKGPVTRKMFPFDDIIMEAGHCLICTLSLIHRIAFVADIPSWIRHHGMHQSQLFHRDITLLQLFHSFRKFAGLPRTAILAQFWLRWFSKESMDFGKSYYVQPFYLTVFTISTWWQVPGTDYRCYLSCIGFGEKINSHWFNLNCISSRTRRQK